MKKKIFTLSALIASFTCSFAQTPADYSKILNALNGAKEDVPTIAAGYFGPLAKALGSGMNSGWYNTAKTHSIGRPDITFAINTVFIPSSELEYDVSNLKSLEPGGPNKSNTAPTIFSTSAAPTDLYLKGTTTKVLTPPNGFNLSIVPIPTAQLGIGLIKNTDLIVRYMPSVTLGDFGSMSLWGVGIKHDIKQWIPGISALPFDLSVLGGYTHFGLTTNLDAKAHPDQKFEMNVGAFNFMALISKKIAILTVYGGLGYEASSTSLKLSGTYDVMVSGTNQKFTDPLDITLDGANSAKLNAGFRIKLAILTLHADYTLAKYSVVSAGLGLSLGN